MYGLCSCSSLTTTIGVRVCKATVGVVVSAVTEPVVFSVTVICGCAVIASVELIVVALLRAIAEVLGEDVVTCGTDFTSVNEG